MRVAYLTASCMLAGSEDERSDSFEHRLEMEQLVPACRARGLQLDEVVWNDPALQPDAFVLGTTWDYQEQPAAFLARLEQLEAATPLLNPLATVRWNLHKRYLTDLEARGVATVPTRWLRTLDDDLAQTACAEWGCDSVVVKPSVGAGSWRQARLWPGEALPPAEELPLASEDPHGEIMVQPFLEAAVGEGEFSLMYFDRVFSHCAQKRPAAGDYRVQAMYGGQENIYEPSSAELAVAQAAVDAVEGPLLYARVDLMRLPSGALAVMELELIEPYFYPEQGPRCGEFFASGLERLLAAV